MKVEHILALFIASTLLISCYGDSSGTESTCENKYGLDAETDLILYTQEQVDLSINRTHVAGNVYIGSCPDQESSRITNLHGLRNLTKIDGSLIILETEVVTIEDFDKLQEIGGALNITMNESLIEIKNINMLKIINGLEIFGNQKLQRITGFSALENCRLALSINVNENLETISGFNNLTHVGEDITIESNSKLIKLEGFIKLTHIEKNILLRDNISITNLEAFNNVTSIAESLDLRYNWKLIGLDNFQRLEAINGNLVIDNHKELKNLNGLSNLTFIGKQLFIANNSKLTNYCGLTNLIQTEGGLQEGNSGPPYYVPYFQIIDNIYNPSRQDLFSGNCSI
jgi:hypothetical protein